MSTWENSRLYAMGALHAVIEEALYACPNDDDALHARIEEAITAYRLSKESWSQKQARRDQEREREETHHTRHS